MMIMSPWPLLECLSGKAYWQIQGLPRRQEAKFLRTKTIYLATIALHAILVSKALKNSPSICFVNHMSPLNLIRRRLMSVESSRQQRRERETEANKGKGANKKKQVQEVEGKVLHLEGNVNMKKKTMVCSVPCLEYMRLEAKFLLFILF